MKHVENNTTDSINMTNTERALRTGLGLAVLLGALHAAITGFEMYPLTMIIASIVVLTGITGWDPLYAAFRPRFAPAKFESTPPPHTAFSPS